MVSCAKPGNQNLDYSSFFRMQVRKFLYRSTYLNALMTAQEEVEEGRVGYVPVDHSACQSTNLGETFGLGYRL